MRTLKQQVIFLDTSESVRIKHGRAELIIEACNPDMVHTLEVTLPAGQTMSGLMRPPGTGDNLPLTFADPEGLIEELRGPVQWISFADVLEVEDRGWSDEQKKLLKAHGFRFASENND